MSYFVWLLSSAARLYSWASYIALANYVTNWFPRIKDRKMKFINNLKERLNNTALAKSLAEQKRKFNILIKGLEDRKEIEEKATNFQIVLIVCVVLYGLLTAVNICARFFLK